MKSIHAAIAVAVALFLALWWILLPPRSGVQAGTLAHQASVAAAPPAGDAMSNTPRAGSVALIGRIDANGMVSSHIAIVEAVSDTSLTIIEGDSQTGAMTRRSASGKDVADAERQLSIVGYHLP